MVRVNGGRISFLPERAPAAVRGYTVAGWLCWLCWLAGLG